MFVGTLLVVLCVACEDEGERVVGPSPPSGAAESSGPQIVKGQPTVPAVDNETRRRKGQPIPAFKAVSIDGDAVDSRDLRGTNVLVIFFSTTCRACRTELHVLDERLPRSKRLVTLAVGRENTKTELAAFRRAEKLDFQFIADPERVMYGLFASSQIPRTYLFDTKGRLVHQTRNYSKEQSEETLRHIGELLKSSQSDGP
jgi:peroxiredoxin